MGLNTLVYKPYKVEIDKIGSINEDDIRVIEDNSLDIFKHLFFEKENEYYDLESPIKEMGYDLESLIWEGTSYGKDVKYTYLDTKHPLYEAKEFLDKVWHILYCGSRKDLFNTVQFQEFKLKYLPILLKYGFKRKYGFFATGSKIKYYNLNSARDLCDELIKIRLINPPIVTKVDTCIAVEEIADQRKGANTLFYEQGIWDHPYITKKSELIDHWNKYFCHPTPESEGGFGSSVEYNQSPDEMRNNFKSIIIDKFIEGETFVSYS